MQDGRGHQGRAGEANNFGVQKVEQLSKLSLQGAATLRGRRMRSSLNRSTTSTFPTGRFCIRLQHGLNLTD